MFMKSIYLFAAFTFAENLEKCAVTSIRESIAETERTIKALATELEQEQCRLLDEYKANLKDVNVRIAATKCEMASRLQTSKLKLNHLEDAMRVIASASKEHTAVLKGYTEDVKKVADAKKAEAELKKCDHNINVLENKQRVIEEDAEVVLEMLQQSIKDHETKIDEASYKSKYSARRRGAVLVSRRGVEGDDVDEAMDAEGAEDAESTEVAVVDEPCMKTKMMHALAFFVGFAISYLIFNVVLAAGDAKDDTKDTDDTKPKAGDACTLATADTDCGDDFVCNAELKCAEKPAPKPTCQSFFKGDGTHCEATDTSGAKHPRSSKAGTTPCSGETCTVADCCENPTCSSYGGCVTPGAWSLDASTDVIECTKGYCDDAACDCKLSCDDTAVCVAAAGVNNLDNTAECKHPSGSTTDCTVANSGCICVVPIRRLSQRKLSSRRWR
jgi:hypothetical protein